jgi:hypothetical protein
MGSNYWVKVKYRRHKKALNDFVEINLIKPLLPQRRPLIPLASSLLPVAFTTPTLNVDGID